MIDTVQLESAEIVRWQGRPAPRCYTFRNWKHSLFGLVLSAPALLWLLIGRELANHGHSPWAAWLPLPFVLISAWLAAGHLFWARLEWDKIFYIVTDQRLLICSGIFSPHWRAVPLAELHAVKVRRIGAQLATIRLERDGQRPILLCCVEQPDVLLRLLQDDAGLTEQENV